MKKVGVFIGLAAFGAIIILSLTLMAFVKVDAGYVGVVTHFGAVQDDLLPEGLHMVNPFKAKIVHINTRIQKMQADATASSKDLQPVTSTVALNYYLSREKANIIYKELGMGYESTIIEPVIQESIKSATANYNAEQLITKRPQVKKDVYEYIKKRLSEHNIIVTDFSIVSFQFSNEFNTAIEQKQIAEQRALTAKNDLERVRMEAEQERLRAQGQSDAQKLLQTSLDDRLLQLKAIEKWDGVLPIVQGEGGGSFIDVTNMAGKRRKK